MVPDRPIRILIIDDDLADREIYKRCLAFSAGWQFDFAEAAAAAAGIEKVRSWAPDCLLLDYNLPDQDGLEMLQSLRSASGRPPCAVVMLTAFGGEELAVQAMKAGVADYLAKGRVTPDTLPHTIINAVEKWRMQAQIEAQQLELQRSARRYQVLLEAMPQMVWMAGADGRMEYANRRWFEYTGLGLAQAVPFDWESILYPADRQRTYQAWSQAQAAGRVFEIEHRLRRAADGSFRWHLVRAAPLPNPATGEILSWFGTCTDIEDQKQLENDQLQRQKLESIGRLAGGVAHDFNNLLVSILGGASLAMDSLPPSHPSQKLLDEVLHAGERAAQLTRQMLAYAGKSNLFVETVDLGKLVKETCDSLRRTLPVSVQLNVYSEAGLGIETDMEQMRQAITDMVTNAIEAVGRGGGTVEVRCGCLDLPKGAEGHNGSRAALPPGKYIAVEVSDTGCGMDEETRKKIFDPFFTTKATGRGLGLAAVQGFVRSNRGVIEIESAPGQGTRFRIVLPAVVAVATKTGSAA